MFNRHEYAIDTIVYSIWIENKKYVMYNYTENIS